MVIRIQFVFFGSLPANAKKSNKPVKETSDEFLFLQVAENDRVILKYHTNECGEACINFIPVFEELSNDTIYKGVVFLVVDADNNPKAKQRILDKKQPVITIYHKGSVIGQSPCLNQGRCSGTFRGVAQSLT